MPVVGRDNNFLFLFSYSTCVLEGDRAEADENINIFG